MPRARLLGAQLLACIVALGAFAVTATACEGGGGGGKELTSLATSLAGGGKEGETITVAEGTKVKDKATLTGKNASKATGKVTYNIFSEKECKTLVKSAGEVTVSGESVPASSEEELEAGKTYYWQAHYGGDTNNDESMSPCTEILNVQATTSLVTKLSGESKEGEALTIAEGSKAKDTATISGTNSSTATGKAVYKIYSEKACKTLVKEAGEVTVTGGSIPASTEEALEGGKTYYWQATYKGDTLHKESTSTCGKEVLNIQAKTTLTTTLSGESQEGEELAVQEEQPVHDTATLAGTNSSTATGKVTYSIYTENECKERVAQVGEVTVEAGKKIASSPSDTLAAGTYYWQAVYSGDSLHQGSTSSCGAEIELVTDKTTLTTSLTGEVSEGKAVEGTTIEVPEGSPIADTAMLHGTSASLATGEVTYDVYSDSECKDLLFEGAQEPVSGELAPMSLSTSLPAGTYYWQAVYSGDTRNQASKSSCGSEVETVDPPPLTTSLSGEGKGAEELEVQESAEVRDTATLHTESPGTATGTATYDVYSNSECTELLANAGTVTLESGGKIPSSKNEALGTGTYYWQASYSGDGSHKARSSACGAEIEVIADTTSITTSLKGESKSGEALEVHEQAPVTDTATLHGSKASLATGTLTYNIYSDSKCEHLYSNAGEVMVTGGSAPSSLEEPLPPGTYYWQAEYTGDSANQPSTSTCGAEVETVTGLTTSLSGGGEAGEVLELQEEVPVSDVATLHSPTASTATGTVEYNIYSDSKCEDLAKSAGDGTMKEGVATASEPQTLSTGTYYWQAYYKGDANHPSQRSACGKEKQQVAQGPQTWVVSVGDSYISGEGGRWAGNTMLNKEWRSIDALGREAYFGEPNGEPNGEEIPLCHRSKSAEIFIGGVIRSKNLACSGAETTSQSAGGAFKPGLDFAQARSGQYIVVPGGAVRGRCPLANGCEGQAKMLQNFARTHSVRMVAVSIGGNDFQFGAVVEACLLAYTLPLPGTACSTTQKAKFEEGATMLLKQRERAIEGAIDRVGEAMRDAGYARNQYSIIVQDYPSPLPGRSTEFRYAQSEGSVIAPAFIGLVRAGLRVPLALGSFRSRMVVGGCPFLNTDAEWANNTALKIIDQTVWKAYRNVQQQGIYPVAFMQLEQAFSPTSTEHGRRLCEQGLTLIGGENFIRGAPLNWLVSGLNPPLPRTANETEWINQVRIRTYHALGVFNRILGRELVPFEIQEDFHPNFWGQLALRNCLRKEYNSGTPKQEGTCTIEGPGLTAVPGGPPPVVRGELPVIRNEPLMALR